MMPVMLMREDPRMIRTGPFLRAQARRFTRSSVQRSRPFPWMKA